MFETPFHVGNIERDHFSIVSKRNTKMSLHNKKTIIINISVLFLPLLIKMKNIIMNKYSSEVYRKTRGNNNQYFSVAVAQHFR